MSIQLYHPYPFPKRCSELFVITQFRKSGIDILLEVIPQQTKFSEILLGFA